MHQDILQMVLDNLQREFAMVLVNLGIPVVDLVALDFPDMLQMVLNMFWMVSEFLVHLVLV